MTSGSTPQTLMNRRATPGVYMVQRSPCRFVACGASHAPMHLPLVLGDYMELRPPLLTQALNEQRRFRRQARALMKAFRLRPGFTPEEFANRLASKAGRPIMLHVAPGHPGGYGALLEVNGTYVIMVQDFRDELLRRHVLLHELVHLALGHRQMKPAKEEPRSLYYIKELEREADAVANHLLWHSLGLFGRGRSRFRSMVRLVRHRYLSQREAERVDRRDMISLMLFLSEATVNYRFHILPVTAVRLGKRLSLDEEALELLEKAATILAISRRHELPDYRAQMLPPNPRITEPAPFRTGRPAGWHEQVELIHLILRQQSVPYVVNGEHTRREASILRAVYDYLTHGDWSRIKAGAGIEFDPLVAVALVDQVLGDIQAFNANTSQNPAPLAKTPPADRWA